MTEDRVDASLKDLEAALDVVPSPEFAVRVRARAAQDRMQVRWLSRLTAVAAAALVLVGFAFWRGEPETAAPPQPTGRTTLSGMRPLEARPVRPKARAETKAIRHSRGPASAAPQAVVGRHPSIWVDARTGALVPGDQQLALIRLLAAIRAGRATVPRTASAMFDAEGLLVPPAPVEIPPVVIDPLPIPAPDDRPAPGSSERSQERNKA